jgi:hypothetical protein
VDGENGECGRVGEEVKGLKGEDECRNEAGSSAEERKG